MNKSRMLKILLIICFSISTSCMVQAESYKLSIPGGIGVKDIGFYDLGLKYDDDGGAGYHCVLLNDNELWSFHPLISKDGKSFKYVSTKISDDVKFFNCNLNNNFFFVKTDNTLWGMGENADGDLGVGNNSRVSEPTKITDNVKSIYFSSYDVYILKNDKSLWGCGINNYGQLGNGTTTNSNVLIKICDNVKDVSTGINKLRFVTTHNHLYMCGDLLGLTGQITLNLDESQVEKLYTPTFILDGVKGFSQYNFLRNDNSIWGYKDTRYYGYYRHPAEIISSQDNQNSKNIYSGSYNNYILRNDGTLLGWGDNTKNNPLGIESTDAVSKPTKIMDNVKWFSIRDNLVLTNNNELYGWGSRLDMLTNKIKNNEEVRVPTKVLDNVLLYKPGSHTDNYYVATDGSLYLIGLDRSVVYVKMINGKDISKSINIVFKEKHTALGSQVVNKNGTTYYPLEDLLSVLGATSTWDSRTKTAIGISNNNKVVFTINNNSYKVNGQIKQMDNNEVPFEENGKTYIPLRACAEGLGFTVSWDIETKTIIIK